MNLKKRLQPGGLLIKPHIEAEGCGGLRLGFVVMELTIIIRNIVTNEGFIGHSVEVMQLGRLTSCTGECRWG